MVELNIKPNLFIVGAPKSGTTSMYNYLAQHPAIFMSEEKEPHFFSTDLLLPWVNTDINKYRSLFSKASKDHLYLGESSTWYLCSKVAAEKIFRFNPDSKIIIMLRNPVDLLLSLFNHRIYTGIETACSLTEAMENEKKRFNSPEKSDQSFFGWGPVYDEVVHFAEQIKRYLNMFGKENVHIIIFDDFIADPSRVYKETLKVLNVEDRFVPVFDIKNPKKGFRNKIIHKFMADPPDFITRLSRIIIPSSTMRIKLNGLIRKLNTSHDYSCGLSRQEKINLQNKYMQEIEELEKLIGKNLKLWKMPG